MIYRRLPWPTIEPYQIILKFRREGPTEVSSKD